MVRSSWIVNIKDKTVRYNTARNYRERYRQNIGKAYRKDADRGCEADGCQKILNDLEADYAGSTIYQTMIALYNMFDSAVENAIILKNPFTKSGELPKPVEKKTKVLTVVDQKSSWKRLKDRAIIPSISSILQTGVRTGEMVGLKWEDIIDFEKMSSRSGDPWSTVHYRGMACRDRRRPSTDTGDTDHKGQPRDAHGVEEAGRSG